MAANVIVRKYLRELIISSFEGRRPTDIPETMSLGKCLSICTQGQICYMLCKALIQISDGHPENELIKYILHESINLSFRQFKAAKEITKAFEQAGIRHQLLKGAILKEIYPSPLMRDMSDIDMVVYDENFDRAVKVLEDMGYINEGLVKHHMIFSQDGCISVELHWCLFDEQVGKAQYLYFKDFRAKLVEGTSYTYEFSHEDFYVYMIAHMAKHFFETGCGIRNLVDIYVYLGKYGDSLDRAYIDEELSRCGIFDFEKNMRELAYIWLEDRECSEFYENLFAYMVDSGIYGKAENGVWGQLAKETKDTSGDYKWRYYFPSIKFMREKYKWLENAPFLLPVAWVIRGFAGVSQEQSREHRKQIVQADKQEITMMLDMYHRLNLDFRR